MSYEGQTAYLTGQLSEIKDRSFINMTDIYMQVEPVELVKL